MQFDIPANPTKHTAMKNLKTVYMIKLEENVAAVPSVAPANMNIIMIRLRPNLEPREML